MIEIGYGVRVDRSTIDRWAQATRLGHMRTVNEIGPEWSALPEEMREAWRDLARAAASEACATLALSSGPGEPAHAIDALRAQVDQYMSHKIWAGPAAGCRHPAT